MKSVWTEGRLQFAFGPSWHQVRWDADNAYRHGIRQLQHLGAGTKAVDCLAVHEKLGLCFLEITDGRGDDRFFRSIASNALFAETAFKVRDSLAGLVGTLSREGRNEEKWEPFREPLHQGKFCVVLWVEQDAIEDPGEMSLWTDNLRKYVRWLTYRRVMVTSLRLGGASLLPDITVTSLPGAGQATRK